MDSQEVPLSFREILTGPVLVSTGSYASFAMLDTSFRTMFPVYLATPMKMGGLGLDPSHIGTLLAAMGLFSSVFQLAFFPPLHSRLGGKTLFLITTSLFFPVAAFCPFTSRVGQEQGLNNLVWLLLGIQIFLYSCANLAFSKSSPDQWFEIDGHISSNPGATFVYVNSAAPNRASMGAVSGFAQMIVAIVRAVGPSAMNSAFALGIEKHVMGGHFAYWLMAGMAAISLGFGVALPLNDWSTRKRGAM